MSVVNEFLAGLPDWSLAVISMSLGWVIGSLIVFVIIELRGGL